MDRMFLEALEVERPGRNLGPAEGQALASKRRAGGREWPEAPANDRADRACRPDDRKMRPRRKTVQSVQRLGYQWRIRCRGHLCQTLQLPMRHRPCPREYDQIGCAHGC